MSRSQREKGKRGERSAAEALRVVYPQARRGWQARDGADAPDVDGTPWWVESKVGRNPPLWPAWRQALEDTDGRPPLVIARRDREEAVALLRLSDLVALLERARDAGQA